VSKIEFKFSVLSYTGTFLVIRFGIPRSVPPSPPFASNKRRVSVRLQAAKLFVCVESLVLISSPLVWFVFFASRHEGAFSVFPETLPNYRYNTVFSSAALQNFPSTVRVIWRALPFLYMPVVDRFAFAMRPLTPSCNVGTKGCPLYLVLEHGSCHRKLCRIRRLHSRVYRVYFPLQCSLPIIFVEESRIADLKAPSLTSHLKIFLNAPRSLLAVPLRKLPLTSGRLLSPPRVINIWRCECVGVCVAWTSRRIPSARC
jgi:hypothetical protein